MSESSGVVAWTAVAALVLSMSTVGYAVYRAARGPAVQAFPTEDILLFGHPGQQDLGAVALFELANTSPDYPDTIVAQSIRIYKGEEPVGCLSARGDGKIILSDPSLPADPAAVHAQGAAEYIDLAGLAISVMDVSTRAELTAGMLLSRRQLFDQRASRSVVDPCSEITREKGVYTLQKLIDDFKGGAVDLRYHADLAESASLAVSCTVNMTDRRAEIIARDGWINVACDKADVKRVAGGRSDLARFFGRVF